MSSPNIPCDRQSPGCRNTSGGLWALLDHFRDPQPEFEMLTPTSSASSANQLLPSRISKLAKIFSDSLHTQQLSNFLIWMIYYDLVEFPSDAVLWYDTLNAMETIGWVALGDVLSHTYKIARGFDLIVLESICDRIDLNRCTVNGLLMKFADPEQMGFTSISAIEYQAEQEGKSTLEAYEAVQKKLWELEDLVSKLKPTAGSTSEIWHEEIKDRLHSFLHVLITPRIEDLRSDAPLIYHATSEPPPEETQDRMDLAHLYVVLQQKRQVPLDRYGICTKLRQSTWETTPSSPGSSNMQQTRTHDHNLRTRIATLVKDRKNLMETNEGLARRVSALTHRQCTGTCRHDMPSIPPILTPEHFLTLSVSSNSSLGSDSYSRILSRQMPGLSRSFSDGAREELVAERNMRLKPPTFQRRTRRHSDSVAFTRLESRFVQEHVMLEDGEVDGDASSASKGRVRGEVI